MKLKEAKLKLEKLTGVKLSSDDKANVSQIASDSKDLYDAINELDDQVFVGKIDDDIDDYVVCFHSGSDKDSDYLGIIIVNANKDVIAYGYTSD